jgi:lysozyme family protein
MADMNKAIKLTLQHEGGFQKNLNDRANWSLGVVGEGDLIGTKYGITALDMPGTDIENLTEEQAIAYYREHYVKPLYSQINDQALAEKLFDMGVLFGVKTAVKLLQVSLSQGISVVSDGVFGPNTLAAMNDHGNINAYRVVLINHCMDVVNRNPQDVEFLHGWTSRIQS